MKLCSALSFYGISRADGLVFIKLVLWGLSPLIFCVVCGWPSFGYSLCVVIELFLVYSSLERGLI
jgi:hypothetical protein